MKGINILAAFIFFTRLPFWRIKEVSVNNFKHIVPYWPLVGWFTGGIMAGVLWLTAQIFPIPTAWIIAIITRLLITGCLHEDGLADFMDGFGGGSTREQILHIMKDSHIGSYGVIGLICYFLLLIQVGKLPLETLCVIVFCGDCWSKFCASQIINILPYARKEEESKAKVLYSHMTLGEWFAAFATGAFPLLLLPNTLWIVILFPILTIVILYALMRKRLQGYTGDCCGAAFLLCELSFLLGSLGIFLHI